MTPFLPPVDAAHAQQVMASFAITPRLLHYTQVTVDLVPLDVAWRPLLLLLLIRARIAAKLDAMLPARVKSVWARTSIVAFSLLALLWLLTLPVSIFAGFVVPHRFGLSASPFSVWFADDVKGTVIDIAIAAACYGLLFSLIARSRRTGAFCFAVALVPVIALGIFATPLVIDPIFNKFTLLTPASRYYAPIHDAAVRAGIPNAKIYVVDKSRQTNETNAYVTGLGSSARIVVWDTLLAKLPPDQLRAVVAHECGHYVEHHIWYGFAMSAIAVLAGVPFLLLIFTGATKRFGPGTGVSDPLRPAALPILMLTLNLSLQIANPVTCAVSRVVEHRADSFGLAITGDRLAMAEAFVSLSKDNLSDPNPPLWVKVLYLDHPPLRERVEFALFDQPIYWPDTSHR